MKSLTRPGSLRSKIGNGRLEKATSGKSAGTPYIFAEASPAVDIGQPSYLRQLFPNTLEQCEKCRPLVGNLVRVGTARRLVGMVDSPKPLCAERSLPGSTAMLSLRGSIPPTLFVPSEINAADLARPKDEESDERFEQWHDIVARTLKRIVVDPGGGTLILCNSYDEIAALAERLTSLGTRLIAQAADESVTRIKSIFVDKARNGKRPIWLATRGTLTGWT